MSALQPGLVVSGGNASSSGGSGTPSPDLHYVHVQSAPDTVWVVQHNLGKYPSITVLDSDGQEVWCAVRHDSTQQITLDFSEPFTGKAVCN